MKNSVLLLAFVIASIDGHGQSAPAKPGADSHAAIRTHVAGSAGVADGGYIIGPSDMLTITVWKDSTLSGNLLVRPDGKISMLLLGDIQAAGLQPMQLATQITQDLTKFMKDPQVSVVVSRIHENFIYLLGEVSKPGQTAMSADMTLLEAISSRGGLTDFANKKKIYILRQVGGKTQRVSVNYKKALQGDPGSNLALMPGDTIVVP